MHSRLGFAWAALLGAGLAGVLWYSSLDQGAAPDPRPASSAAMPSEPSAATSQPAAGSRAVPEHEPRSLGAATATPAGLTRYDRALAALQDASARGAQGHELARVLEATWRAALDTGAASEAASILADWQDHPEPQVRELVAEALAALAAAQQIDSRPATDPTLGHESLRDQALYGSTTDLRRDAISELALLDHPQRDAWLTLIIDQESDPALRDLAHSFLAQTDP